MWRSLLICALLLPSVVQALTISTDTVWRGEKSFTEMIRVAPEATLTLAPGSRLVFTGGGLEVAGQLVAQQVSFIGKSWQGIELKGCDERTLIHDTQISGARIGILIGGGAPRLERITLTDNGVGIEARRKSTATIRNCIFEKNRKVGLFVKDEATPAVEGCRFSANGKYGAYIYRAAPQTFKGNQFEGNPTGLMIAYYGSDPLIRENRFSTNQIAVLVDRAARPTLQANLLIGNQTGIRLYRRSDAIVAGNLLTKNKIAISIAYSSYPEIRSNDFVANDLALELEFQSSTWERERGQAEREATVSQQGAFGRKDGGQVTEAERRPQRLDGKVYARENWWGETGTAELIRIGKTGNPSFIHDGRDTPTFEEGGKNYPLDNVVFSPWLTKPAAKLMEQ